MNEKHESYLVQRWELETRSEADERTRVYLTPKRIVWETNDKDASVENSAALLEQKSRQISLHADSLCTLCSREHSAGLLLDFGQEMHGGLEFSVQSVSGAK